MAEGSRIRTHLVLFCIRVRVTRHLGFALLCSSGEKFDQHGGQKIPDLQKHSHMFRIFLSHSSFPLAIAPLFFISQSVDIALMLAVSWGKTHISYGRIVFRLSDRASDSWRRGILFLFFVCYLSIPVK